MTSHYNPEERKKYGEIQNWKNAVWELYNEGKIHTRTWQEFTPSEKILVDKRKNELETKYRIRKLNLQNNGKLENNNDNYSKKIQVSKNEWLTPKEIFDIEKYANDKNNYNWATEWEKKRDDKNLPKEGIESYYETLYQLKKQGKLKNPSKPITTPKNNQTEPILFGEGVKNPRKIYQANYKKDWYGTAFFINDRLDEKQKNKERKPKKENIIAKNRLNTNIDILTSKKGLFGRTKIVKYKPKEVKRQSFFNLPKLIGFK